MARSAKQRYVAARNRVKRIDERTREVLAQMKERRDDASRKMQEALNEIKADLAEKQEILREETEMIDEDIKELLDGSNGKYQENHEKDRTPIHSQ